MAFFLHGFKKIRVIGPALCVVVWIVLYLRYSLEPDRVSPVTSRSSVMSPLRSPPVDLDARLQRNTVAAAHLPITTTEAPSHPKSEYESEWSELSGNPADPRPFVASEFQGLAAEMSLRIPKDLKPGGLLVSSGF